MTCPHEAGSGPRVFKNRNSTRKGPPLFSPAPSAPGVRAQLLGTAQKSSGYREVFSVCSVVSAVVAFGYDSGAGEAGPRFFRRGRRGASLVLRAASSQGELPSRVYFGVPSRRRSDVALWTALRTGPRQRRSGRTSLCCPRYIVAPTTSRGIPHMNVRSDDSRTYTQDQRRYAPYLPLALGLPPLVSLRSPVPSKALPLPEGTRQLGLATVAYPRHGCHGLSMRNGMLCYVCYDAIVILSACLAGSWEGRASRSGCYVSGMVLAIGVGKETETMIAITRLGGVWVVTCRGASVTCGSRSEALELVGRIRGAR